jgi:hypothetical protein
MTVINSDGQRPFKLKPCMPKRITIQPHLSLDELEIRYRGAKDPIERSHYQIIWLLACGRATEEVADVTG